MTGILTTLVSIANCINLEFFLLKYSIFYTYHMHVILSSVKIIHTVPNYMDFFIRFLNTSNLIAFQALLFKHGQRADLITYGNTLMYIEITRTSRAPL